MKRVILSIAALVFATGIAMAQVNPTAAHTVSINVPAVSLIGIGGGTSITLSPVAPTVAGETFTAPVANSTLWLNLTSIVASGTRSVNVSITNGTLSEALSVTVELGNLAENGDGNIGEWTGGVITLDNTPVDIITGIGSGYTGTGDSGFNLKYNLVINETGTETLFAETSTLTVTYTMTAE